MPKYRITTPYWDGAQLHPVDAVLEFAEGEAPPRSRLIEQEKPAAPAAKK